MPSCILERFFWSSHGGYTHTLDERHLGFYSRIDSQHGRTFRPHRGHSRGRLEFHGQLGDDPGGTGNLYDGEPDERGMARD